MGKVVGTSFLIAGAGLGAGCMYLMDPDRGRSRRALLRNKMAGAYHEVQGSVERARADLANRAEGFLASAKSVVQHEPVGDDQLVGRVRARIGRLVSHSHAIEVAANRGRITLSGDVLEAEADQLVAGVASVRDVLSVSDHLLRHRDATHVPTLQGGREPHTEKPGFLRHEWPPAFRMLAGVAGGGLGVYGLLSSRRAVRAVALPFGLGLLARGVGNGRARTAHHESLR